MSLPRALRHHGRTDKTDYANGVMTIQCYTCKKYRPWYDCMYRCFDCGLWLCAECVVGHFSNRHEPHPAHLAEWERAVADLTRKLEVYEGGPSQVKGDAREEAG